MARLLPSSFLILWLVATPVLTVLAQEETQDDPAQAAKDATIVETLSRLPNFDINSNEKIKAAVLRHLSRQKGTPEYLSLVEKFGIKAASDDLLALAIAKPDQDDGVKAARLLLDFDQADKFAAMLNSGKEEDVVAAATAVSLVGGSKATELLSPLLESDAPAAAQVAAANGLAQTIPGQKHLLELAEGDKLPGSVKLVAASALANSTDDAIRTAAAKVLPLPDSGGGKPLPSLDELTAMAGNAAVGKEMFGTKGTCSKCHKVDGEGKDIGPDLSEIGSKLSKQAMYVSILDPSAAVSHNYESYAALTFDGLTVTGIKLSETDDDITLRTAEGITKTLKKDDLEELRKMKKSIMPDGLQKTLTVEELASLVEYLMTLKKKG